MYYRRKQKYVYLITLNVVKLTVKISLRYQGLEYIVLRDHTVTEREALQRQGYPETKQIV